MLKWIKNKLPQKHEIKRYKALRLFGKVAHKKGLWQFDHHSLAKAFAIGLFWMWIPMPFQMVPAALCAILLSANLPLSMATVWISNPVTMPPMFFFCYKIGDWMLGVKVTHVHGTGIWFFRHIIVIWKPLLLGCFVMATVSSLIGYFVVQFVWWYRGGKGFSN